MSRTSAADILCIGAQRSMTSWLHRIMVAHPQTWAFPNFEPLTSTSKEAHYWDWNHKRGEDWYRVLMRPLDDHRKSLDFTPEYAFLTDAQIAECKQINPTASVIYILRDPLARAVSAIRMRTMWVTQNAAADEHRVTYGQAFLDRCANAQISEHSAYTANIERWRRHYPDLTIVNFEDLSRDPLPNIKHIFAQSGLEFDVLSQEAKDTIQHRSAEVVWQTPHYELDADCLQFLNGATFAERQSTADELGIEFTEGDALLAGTT